MEKCKKDLTIFELELIKIPLGEYTPEGEVHNIKEIVSKVIERVEKGEKHRNILRIMYKFSMVS